MRRVASLWLVLGACAEPTGTRSQAVVGGQLDAGDPAVVAIVPRRAGCAEVTPVLCTGTLIAPRAVLTAAHCLEDLDRGASFEVFAGGEVGDGAYRLVTAHRISSTWDGVTGDVAVIRLDSPFDAITPIPIPSDPIDGTAIGQDVRVVGFGLDDADATTPDGRKREGTMRVVAVVPGAFTAEPSPASSCQGDSGGPVLLDRGAGEEVVGVTASGDAGCDQLAENVRVDAFLGEIAGWLAEIEASPEDLPEAAIALDAVCTAPCVRDDECPADLRCVENDGERRCATMTAVPLAYGEACVDDDGCGGEACARVWSHGDEACRCATSCEKAPVGCAGCAAEGGESSAGALGIAVLMLLACRRRV